jgi:hypothetical protein
MRIKKTMLEHAINSKKNDETFEEFRERVEAEKLNQVYKPKTRKNFVKVAAESLNFDDFCHKAEE